MRKLLPGIALCVALALFADRLATLPVLKVFGPLTLALIFGIALRALAGPLPWSDPGSKLCARPVLRIGVFLMGARLDFALVAKVGSRVLLLDLLLICVGVVGIAWLARAFAVPAKLATLLAVGTSICGASAVVAAGAVTRAEEDDVTLAVALCGILGTAGVLFYVLLGPSLPLSLTQLAILCGSTLHEVAQVIAAAFTWGNASGDLGTLVKLVRVVLLAPALLALGIATRGHGVRYSFKEPPVPWFVIGFLALGIAGSLGGFPGNNRAILTAASIFLMTCAMAAMGLHTPLGMIRRAGARVLYAGLAAFGCMALLSFLLIRALRIS
ncbi:MAG TPA: putative sulfate exporter family transporter [Myxococcales bacterium]|nr:putative sulfate exporter family transporter [Myxococcales bacterium]